MHTNEHEIRREVRIFGTSENSLFGEGHQLSKNLFPTLSSFVLIRVHSWLKRIVPAQLRAYGHSVRGATSWH